ncbi:LacI family DNA-binding transcriptional regulator [Ornithinimicrobium faecis]|uniref:LacI family DNA-binding transcriptional regulator n=1 Tax=Ornithinimicrobium faecis TaxID=2934158 RepID=UPI0021177B59|nr:LacI family DNA-binding transcriptional regulator [Ornithinimicrobium sp. HY1745]
MNRVAKSVTLSQVAREAGVSQATASRALSNSDHKVNEDTRRHIFETAKRLGYKVNPIARALRRSVTGTVGMVVPSLENPFFTELVSAVEHVLAQQNLNLFLSDSRNDLDTEAQRLRAFTDGSVDGVLISPCDSTGSLPAVDSTAKRVPLVQLDRRVDDLDCPWVGIDDEAAMNDLFTHLSSIGVRSAALITSTGFNSSARDRTDFARQSATACGITLRPEHLLDGEFSIAWGAAAIDRLLSTDTALPDAVVCTDDIQALGAMSRLRTRGLRVPQDLFITGFDDIVFSSLVDPTITTIKQPVNQMAETAVSLLAGSDEERETRVTFRGQLVARGTTQSSVCAANLSRD